MAKKTETESTELSTKVQGTAMAEAPAFIDESDFQGAGFEGVDKDSYAIPFIQVLQKMSPMVDEDDPKYVDGAKAGMLYNTVTGKLYDGRKGIIVIPSSYKRSYVRWGGRDAGGGFKGEYTPDQIEKMIETGELSQHEGRLYAPDENGKIDVKKSDYVADTRSHYVIIEDEETGETSFAVLALSSTLTKASRNLMTMLQSKKIATAAGLRTPPTYANRVRMTTVAQSNDKGSWSGVKFDLEGLVTNKAIYEEAKSFYNQVTGGKVKADFSKADNSDHSESSEGGATTADNF
ncbi:hypothetical protein [Xanthomonas phage Carpasina]|uniref:Phage protein n=3 Tax=Carpasinavirus TaxID=2733099 RepID=A0A858NQ11_9CAUD|nr:hypothetical protein HOT16_gp39 [Xanthomonas phage Carpasina]AWD92434.1 hypothetical protein [Xanthomonas phage Carpasina]QJB22101.1 hypothetical protein XccvBFoX6_gp43c [Xanthomonas phage FoX6]QJB22200.1 hypothetical protein XccvBFoX7_gp43c [Xanthomonas phage FoX7]